MRPDGKLADALRVVTYGTLGLVFFLFASNDRAPDWMPFVIGAVFFAGVGYCAWGWREARWKLILGLLPGILAAILLLTWYGIHSTAISSINLGSRFSLQALQEGLTLRETTQGPSQPMLWETPEWARDMWRAHIRLSNIQAPAAANIPGARQSFFFVSPGQWVNGRYTHPNIQAKWVLPRSTASIFIPIWSAAAILGIPTLFWTAVATILWLWRRTKQNY